MAAPQPPPPDDPRFGFDPVAAFLRRPLHEIVGSHVAAPAQPPAPDPAADRSVEGLRQLAKQYAWAAVLDLATSLLAEHEDHETAEGSVTNPFLPHQRLFCIAYRALALLQTRQVASAANAVAQLGPLTPANEKYRYESYPSLYPLAEYPAGSFVPFELTLLVIEIRIRQGNATAIADCYNLKRAVAKQVANETNHAKKCDLHLQEGVLLSSLASYHLIAQQHDAAADIARELVAHQGRTSAALYMYMRVLLQIGDFESAAKALHEAEKSPGSTPALQHLHSGLLLAARGRYQEALLMYDTVLAEEKVEQPRISLGNIWVHAANNAAVCLMHCGRLAEAIDRLEGTLRRNPEVALDEGLTFNLAVMYDLAYPQNSKEKKQVLRDLASRFGRQGFDLEKIPMKNKDKK